MQAQGTVRAAGELTPLVRLFRANWRPVTLTYALYSLENVLNIAHPMVLGVAINGLIPFEYSGLALLVGQHLAHLFVGTARQMYDTRAFTAIYTHTVTPRLQAAGRRGWGLDRGREVGPVLARSWSISSSTGWLRGDRLGFLFWASPRFRGGGFCISPWASQAGWPISWQGGSL